MSVATGLRNEGDSDVPHQRSKANHPPLLCGRLSHVPVYVRVSTCSCFVCGAPRDLLSASEFHVHVQKCSNPALESGASLTSWRHDESRSGRGLPLRDTCGCLLCASESQHERLRWNTALTWSPIRIYSLTWLIPVDATVPGGLKERRESVSFAREPLSAGASR